LHIVFTCASSQLDIYTHACIKDSSMINEPQSRLTCKLHGGGARKCRDSVF